MNKKFNVKYPFYKNTEKPEVNLNNYQVDSYPSFYLIDKKGKIIKGINGFSPKIAEDLKKLIIDNLD